MFHHFNSIKVQLELEAVELPSQRLEFQFHKGTIRTLRSAGSADGLLYFNSIKVQLEPSD